MGKVRVLIPARYESTRFRGKPLFHLVGANGKSKSLLRRSYEAASASGYDPLVLTDDHRIAAHCDEYGIPHWVGAPEAQNGSERCAMYAAAEDLDGDDIIVNFQGDACLTPPEWVDILAASLKQDQTTKAATMVGPMIAAGWPGSVSAVFDRFHRALYFSRSVIPHGPGPKFQHFGIYAYRVKTLKEAFLNRWRPGPAPLEVAESLEQLRLLESGFTLQCIESPSGVRLPRCEVNTPEDLGLVERELQRWGIE